MRAPAHHWTDEEKAWLKANVKGKLSKELTELFNEHFGFDVSNQCIKSGVKRFTDGSGVDCKFQKGFTPFQKGRKRSEYMSPEAEARCRAGRFKKGHEPHTKLPVGTETITTDGYVKIKTAEPNKWKFKHIILWEEANGPVPEGYILRFIDGNRQNCSLNNLMLMTRAEHLEAWRTGLLSDEPEINRSVFVLSKLMVESIRRKK